MTDEQTRSRSRAGNGDTYLQPAIRRGASHLLRDGSRVAEEPRQAAQIEHDSRRRSRPERRRRA